MAIQDQIDRLNNEVDEQAALIAEISDILATKAGGSGGTTLETCTVTLTDEPFSYIDYMSPTGRFCGEIDSSVTKINVVKGSLLYGSYPETIRLTLTGGVSKIMIHNFTKYVLVINGDGDIAFTG